MVQVVQGELKKYLVQYHPVQAPISGDLLDQACLCDSGIKNNYVYKLRDFEVNIIILTNSPCFNSRVTPLSESFLGPRLSVRWDTLILEHCVRCLAHPPTQTNRWSTHNRSV